MTAKPAPAAAARGLRGSAARIAPLAWPVVIGQIAVLAFSTVDTIIVGRHATTDLAALSVGAAAYTTIFIGLMGVVMSISPIAGRLFGADQYHEAGHQFWQAVWLALGLAIIGAAVMCFPEPFLAWSKAPPAMAHKVRMYLLALAFALPATLVFSAFRGFNTAVSRPKTVMLLQLCGLALKVPLSLLLVDGLPALAIPALGVVGCGIGTVVVMWSQVLVAVVLMRRDPFYARFALTAAGQRPPQWASLRAMLKLGIPMGLSIGVEVTAFSAMALFIARLGETPVAAHQIALNLMSLLFMLPMGLANGTATLVAQRIGANDLADARRLGSHGVLLALGLALLVGATIYLARVPVVALYTREPAVAAVTVSLLAWVVLFHAADAVQTLAAFVLRAWHVATVPTLIYVLALWGVGIGGGNWLAFNLSGNVPAVAQGVRGFWIASTAGLTLAALLLAALMAWLSKHRLGR